jgi:transposase
LEARNVEAVVRALEQAKGESAKARFEVARIVVGFESGRDGFWIARALQQRGLEVHVMHAASIAVERRGKRAKTDRLDVDLLLTTFDRLAARRPACGIEESRLTG